ncbi:MAG: lycopene cyclase domain-containing protein [Bacteroidales bacterium]|jgi:lycopene cyclase domain-containing protein|nr:lycopene cyclase domain-containing protein [Bacteroidales bacterium]
MKDTSWTYFLLLGLSILYPLAQSFEKRIFMYKKMKFIFPGILFSASLFLLWDVLFTKAGIWSFNHDYTKELYILGLPLEEWLFFLIIPYCIFFLYEVLRFFVKKFYFPIFSKYLIWFLISVSTISLPFVYEKTYTFTVIAFIIPFLGLQLLLKTYKTWFSGFFLSYLISFIPFIIVNGFLTRLPVVLYNNAENLSFRITTIPAEDFIYLFGMLLPAFTIYQLLLHKYGSSDLKSKMKLNSTSGF